MKNRYKILIYIIICCSLIISQAKKYQLSTLDNNKIKQAKALEKNGQFNEAEFIYIDMLTTSPFIREALIPLKKIYFNKNAVNEFIEYADRYLESHNNHYLKQLDVIDIYIKANHKKMDTIINQIMNTNFSNKKNKVKPLLKNLLYNNYEEKAINIINSFRIGDKSYYSQELAIYHSINFNFEKSINEYLLFLDNNPRQLNYISNKIMLLSEYPNTMNIIRTTLSNSSSEEAKIILSNLEFKSGNLESCYSIIKTLKDDTYIINFIKDLIQIENFDLAQEVISYTLETYQHNPKIIDKAVFQLAQICEIKIQHNVNNSLLTSEINYNQLLSTNLIEFEATYNDLLNTAMNIYDSLRINSKDNISTYHLAEIKYKIQKDFEGAIVLYNDVYNNNTKLTYKELSLSRIIDININQNNIKNITDIIQEYKQNTSNQNINTLLDIKIAQLYFFQGNRDSTISYCHKLLTSLPRDNSYYNDLLDLISIAYLFEDEEEFKNYTYVKLLSFQNNLSLAKETLDNMDSKNEEINNLYIYELAYANFLTNDYSLAIDLINQIPNESIYKEYALILISEIYQYKLNNSIEAIKYYNEFINLFSNSIYYDTARLRLRELINKEYDS